MLLDVNRALPEGLQSHGQGPPFANHAREAFSKISVVRSYVFHVKRASSQPRRGSRTALHVRWDTMPIQPERPDAHPVVQMKNKQISSPPAGWWIERMDLSEFEFKVPDHRTSVNARMDTF